jgi:hypothetical protein
MMAKLPTDVQAALATIQKDLAAAQASGDNTRIKSLETVMNSVIPAAQAGAGAEVPEAQPALPFGAGGENV